MSTIIFKKKSNESKCQANKLRCLAKCLPNESRTWLRGRGWPCAKEIL